MHKHKPTVLLLSMIILLIVSCAPKEEAPQAGSAEAEDMLTLLPVDAQGVFFIDFNKAMSIEMANKLIQEEENYKKYTEFVEKTGIDPQTDVYFIAVALMGEGFQDENEGAAVINLKYDKDKILTLMEEEVDSPLLTEDYNGMFIYTKEDEKHEGFAFLDESNVVLGEISGIKSCIDVIQKNKENIFKNPDLSALLDKTDKSTLFWGAMLLSAETMDKATSDNPMLQNLGSVRSITLNFDYKDKNILAEIKAESEDATKNQQVVDAINGLKALGSMMTSQKPEVGELLNKIEVSSAENFVKISANIPEELINKLKSEKAVEPEEKEEIK